jgi:hypothetical protein
MMTNGSVVLNCTRLNQCKLVLSPFPAHHKQLKPAKADLLDDGTKA